MFAFRHCLIVGALLVTAMPAIAQAPAPTIAAAVADAGRPQADKDRDVNRKPAEMLAFAGVKPGMKIVELAPGGGYYTRLLSNAVGPTGHVYAIVSQGQAQRPGGLDAVNAIAAANGNVTIIASDMKSFKAPVPADVVWTALNYHDFHNGPTADMPAFNKNVAAALKKGGVFYVEDHSAPGTGVSATSTLHRIDPAAAKAEVTAAGLTLVGESTALAVPADNHSARVQEADIRGKTDRFVLLFRKP